MVLVRLALEQPPALWMSRVHGAPAAAPPPQRFETGSFVLVQRSNGETSLGRVESYDAASRPYALYYVLLSSGDAKHCPEFELADGTEAARQHAEALMAARAAAEAEAAAEEAKAKAAAEEAKAEAAAEEAKAAQPPATATAAPAPEGDTDLDA